LKTNYTDLSQRGCEIFNITKTNDVPTRNGLTTYALDIPTANRDCFIQEQDLLVSTVKGYRARNHQRYANIHTRR